MTYEINRINAVKGGEAYLVTSGKDAVLVDSGYASKTKETIANITRYLDGRKLKHIILTHSHYDHVMGSAAISQYFSDAKIYAHPKVRAIFAKPNARKFMEDMNKAAAIEQGVSAESGWTEKMHVDVDVTDGQIIDAGDMKIKVVGTPGHTSCSISLYFENEDLLVASETLGLSPDFPEVVPGFIVSYNDAVQSIKKIGDLNPDHLLLPHGYVINGDDIDLYIENSLEEANHVHHIIVKNHNNGKSIDQIVDILMDIYYKGNFKKFQPDEAFYANWIPLVNKVINTLAP